jgi:hypothetical protein
VQKIKTKGYSRFTALMKAETKIREAIKKLK